MSTDKVQTTMECILKMLKAGKFEPKILFPVKICHI